MIYHLTVKHQLPRSISRVRVSWPEIETWRNSARVIRGRRRRRVRKIRSDDGRSSLKSCDMSRKGTQNRARSDVWLRRNELRVWLAYMRAQQRVGYQMKPPLHADSDLSLADYHGL